MNDLFTSDSFFRYNNDDQNPSHVIEMSSKGGARDGINLDKFFQDVEAIKDEFKHLKTLYNQLQFSHDQSKTFHKAKSVKDLRSKMDAHVFSSLKKVKLIKLRLESLNRSNAANHTLPGCGPGNSSNRTRTFVVNGLDKKLHDSMTSFHDLCQRMVAEYRDTVQCRYFTVIGEKADNSILNSLISIGQSETFLQKAIQEQGRGQVMETILEIQERHDAVKG